MPNPYDKKTENFLKNKKTQLKKEIINLRQLKKDWQTNKKLATRIHEITELIKQKRKYLRLLKKELERRTKK